MRAWLKQLPDDYALALKLTGDAFVNGTVNMDNLNNAICQWGFVFRARLVRNDRPSFAFLTKKQFDEFKKFTQTTPFLKHIKVRMHPASYSKCLVILDMDDVNNVARDLEDFYEANLDAKRSR